MHSLLMLIRPVLVMGWKRLLPNHLDRDPVLSL